MWKAALGIGLALGLPIAAHAQASLPTPATVSGQGSTVANMVGIYCPNKTNSGLALCSDPNAAALPVVVQPSAAATALNSVNGVTINLGQSAMATSLPVAIASDQTALNAIITSLPALPAGTNSIGTVGITPLAGTPTQVAATCATTSSTLIAAGAATTFLKVTNNAANANPIWVRWDGATATTAAPAEEIPVGGSSTWIARNGYLPGLSTCIGQTAAVTVSVTYK
jgi:hypothetical protein